MFMGEWLRLYRHEGLPGAAHPPSCWDSSNPDTDDVEYVSAARISLDFVAWG